jgi:hypothetical protein
MQGNFLEHARLTKIAIIVQDDALAPSLAAR